MEIKKIKPSLWLLLIPAIVSVALIVVIVMSISSIAEVFAPMIKINSPEDSYSFEETGTYYIYKPNIDVYGDQDSITILDQDGRSVPIIYSNSYTTMTINNQSYRLVGSFNITSTGRYYFSSYHVQLSISQTSVGDMIGSIFALVGGILGLVFFNIIFLTILFVARARNRRRIQMEAYGTSGNYPGGHAYNPYYNNSGGFPPSYGR